MRIAVIGSGISGSLVARLLSTRHEVTLFEANGSVGGHANTVDVTIGDREYPVDTGFMVFNRRTYPHFCQLLALLDVRSQPSDMSFSVRCARTGWEYQGSSLNGLFAQRSNLVRPRFLRMLLDIARFNQAATAAAASGTLRDGRSVGQFLAECGCGEAFIHQYLVPMAAAIWSSRPEVVLDFPAAFLIGFFANHGLIQLGDRPQWRTIVGGSRRYLEALLQPIEDRIRLRTPVRSVARHAEGVTIELAKGHRERFDEVVLACHADQSLRLLADSSPQEREVLRAFPYQSNEAVLHTDCRLLPRRRRAWASWNYYVPPGDPGNATAAASVTYDLTRLQSLPGTEPLLLTLNPAEAIDPDRVLRTLTYHHPSFSAGSLQAQRRFHDISGVRRTHYCGAYWGYGFHEDGVRSALVVAGQFGIGLEACTAASITERSRTTALAR